MEVTSSRISILEEDVAKKIAAGEVIDRPFSIIRELVDNSIDAASTSIDVSIDRGGVGRIRVVDNGHGMPETDLALCYRRHATSKIKSTEDILQVRTLGFRGEALSSIAACAKLEIVSFAAGQTHAHRVRVFGGSEMVSEDYQGTQGTVVDVSDLFFNLPARRKFLKSTAAESGMCKTAFLDKAIAHPHIAFCFSVDGVMKIFLPESNHITRAHSIYFNPTEASMLELLEGDGEGFSVKVVAGHPALMRRDRRMIQIFVNRRRINEYSLVQACQFGYSEYIPGGNFPVGFVFIDMEPELVDFNVHPAKSEARFRNLPQIHHAIVKLIKNYLRSQPGLLQNTEAAIRTSTVSPQESSLSGFPPSESAPSESAPPETRFQALRSESQLPQLQHSAVEIGTAHEKLRYYGQTFGLFLLAEYKNDLYIIDQHAAHERILFEGLIHEQQSSQELLVPICFEASEDEARHIRQNLHRFAEIGISVQESSELFFEVLSLPEPANAIADEEIVDFLKALRGITSDLRRDFFQRVACRGAIKEGEAIDSGAAMELLQAVFKLKNVHCPHGRPLWYRVSQEYLLKAVGRKR